MVFEIINNASKFIADNPALIAMVVVVVEYVKRWVEPMIWYKSVYMTALGFVLGFVFAIPLEGFVGIDLVLYATHAIALGGVATGLFKVGNTLARTASK